MLARAESRARGADLQSRIEEIAERLFIAHGYNGVSYLDIAGELQMSHSNVHYYYRTKSILADVVLEKVSRETIASMKTVWASDGASFFDMCVGMRDWCHEQYLVFNPTGKGSHLWGLLARFSMDADLLAPDLKRTIGRTLRKIEEHISAGIQARVDAGEFVATAPIAGITLQIASVIASTGHVTRSAASFNRLDELLHWTYASLARAWGVEPALIQEWPALRGPKGAG